MEEVGKNGNDKTVGECTSICENSKNDSYSAEPMANWSNSFITFLGGMLLMSLFGGNWSSLLGLLILLNHSLATFPLDQSEATSSQSTSSLARNKSQARKQGRGLMKVVLEKIILGVVQDLYSPSTSDNQDQALRAKLNPTYPGVWKRVDLAADGKPCSKDFTNRILPDEYLFPLST